MNIETLSHWTAPETLEDIAGRTRVVILRAARQTVFNYLADIENLPRWAGGFCEHLYLSHGRWMGLTSLGELFFALDADVAVQEISLRAGWDPACLWRLTLVVREFPPIGTRVKFSLKAGADEVQRQLHETLEAELPSLITRLGGGRMDCLGYDGE